MAKNKKTFSSKKDRSIVTYVFIGFGALFAILSIALIIFNSMTLDYSDFEHFDDYSEVLDQPEIEYLVYYYTEACVACKAVKDDILDFADDNSYGMKVYFIDASKITGVDYFGFNYTTPTMLMILDGTVAESVVGAEGIIAILESIENLS